jgi:hypothetical protein
MIADNKNDKANKMIARTDRRPSRCNNQSNAMSISTATEDTSILQAASAGIVHYNMEAYGESQC